MAISWIKKSEKAKVRYTSVLDIHSKKQVSSRHYAVGTIIYFLLLTAYCLLPTTYSYAEVIDRVVAYIDDTAITLSEFQENYLKMRKTVESITKEEVINSMINRILLIKEARRMRLEATTDDELLQDYIDIKIKSLIIIKEEKIQEFYNKHINEFKEQPYLTVRDDIEKYLFEMEANKQIKIHLEELRRNAEVRINIGVME